MKKIFAIILSAIMLFGLCIPAAADSGEEGSEVVGIDIPAGEGIWIKEKPDKTGAWFGADNKPPVFEISENLSNRWLTPDSDDWKEALLKISDEAIVNEIKVKNYWIYLKEEMIAEDEKLQDIYVKTESDWNEEDIKAEYIDTPGSEFPFSILSMQEELDREYSAHLILTHFSTFSEGSAAIVIAISAAAVIAFIVILKKKKKAKE